MRACARAGSALERTETEGRKVKGKDGHLSFSSKRPREVTERAQMNSLKSMVPFLFSSNTLKT